MQRGTEVRSAGRASAGASVPYDTPKGLRVASVFQRLWEESCILESRKHTRRPQSTTAHQVARVAPQMVLLDAYFFFARSIFALVRSMSGPSKPWELNANSRRRRVRSYLLQVALWAPPTLGEKWTPFSKRGCSNRTGDDAARDRWPGLRCNRAQQRPPNLADAAHAKACQSSSDEPRPGRSSDIAAAELSLVVVASEFGVAQNSHHNRQKQTVTQPQCDLTESRAKPFRNQTHMLLDNLS